MAISTGLVVEKSRWRRISAVTQGDHQDYDDNVEFYDGDDDDADDANCKKKLHDRIFGQEILHTKF